MIFHQPSNSLTNYNYNIARYTDTVWESHFHRNLELIYVMHGEVLCTVNGTQYGLTAGSFGLCLPYDVHRYEPDADTLYWVMVFSEDFVRAFSADIAGRRGVGFEFCPCEPVRRYLLERLVEGSEQSTLALKSCLYAACDEYFREVTLVEKNEREMDAVSKISDYVAENYTKRISLQSIAKTLGYDYNYMSRYFHRSFNMSFSDFVNTYRLEHAIRLLDEGEQSITQVALDSGFQSVRSFNNYFRKSMSTSPSEYRNGRSRAATGRS